MATFRKSIVGWQAKPDDSGEVWHEPFTIEAANDVWENLALVFDDSATRDGYSLAWEVPQNYGGTNANVVVVWTSGTTGGDVEYDFDYRAVGGDDSESLDQAGNQESLNQEDTAPINPFNRMEASLAMTPGNLAPGDTVESTLFRDGTDVGDTLADKALVFGVLFEWDD